MPPDGTSPPQKPFRAGQRARAGIGAIRKSLGLGPEEEARVRGLAVELTAEVPKWVDSFYTRLLTDPGAMEILHDDARVIRLKRNLHSWFHELFTLPWDEDFERLRETVGDAHVSIQLPTHMMVTSMAGVRQDIIGHVLEAWDHEPEEARENARVLSLALDMELTLMLVAYRRRDRTLARQKDRMVYAQRAARRLTYTLYDRVDAALCYVEMARVDDKRRTEWLTKLRDVLRGLARFDRRMQVHAKINGMAPRRVAVADVITKALNDVSLEGTTRMEVDVEPPDLEATIVPRAIRLAVEELAQNSVRHAPGGTIKVSCRREPLGKLVLEVTDEGPGWGPSIRSFKDIYTLGSGLGLSFCELVAELHEGAIDLFAAPTGGAGVRLVIGTAPTFEDEV